MPIYLNIDGTSREANGNHPSGINVLMSDGSVRFLRDTTSDGTWSNKAALHIARRTAVDRGSLGMSPFGGFRGGVHVAVGDLDSAAPVSGISATRLVFGNEQGVWSMESDEPGVVSRSRRLFGNGVIQGKIVISIGRAAVSAAANKAHCSNNLKQIGIAAHSSFPTVNLLFSDEGRTVSSRIELSGGVSIVSCTISGNTAAAVCAFELNYGKIRYLP